MTTNPPLSSGDVTRITGIPAGTLDDWARKGIVEPQGGGGGKGKFRRWTVAQATALTFAAEWKARGAGPPLLRPLLRQLMKLTGDDLIKAFSQGRTHLLKFPGGDLVAPPLDTKLDLSQFNLARVFQTVMATIEVMANEPRNRLGRSRGLQLSGETITAE